MFLYPGLNLTLRMDHKVFDIHLFVCCNQRVGVERLSCGEEHGMELVAAFKKQINDAGLPYKIRAQRAGCLGICDFGPTIAIYPEGIFYGGVKESDIGQIIDEHILNDRPVERLVIDFSIDK